ncbi:hypothetical protein NC99_05530 [Sunxiuqinia dokdonensis]|uniref:Uncharacterized protein n=1 Tax=Sunxiuqinia dokdonensis TaxID=1409788 RepID=A0A0L8VDP7_9BACT|nr:hypothetical protein NC99_05530 [Sunxiuqinia dokdonensis]
MMIAEEYPSDVRARLSQTGFQGLFSQKFNELRNSVLK